MSELVQSDGVGLLFAREATLGTQPTTGFVQLQPNSSGITATTRQNVVVERDSLLSPNLTSERGAVVGYDVSPQIVHDVTLDLLYALSELIARSSTNWPGGTGLGFFRPTAITTGAWTVAASGALPAGTIVRCDGATNAANNGLHVLTTGSTSTSIATADTLVAETPPTNCVLRVVGFQCASGDCTLDASGNIVTTTLDCTTIGLVVGMPIVIGDPTSGAAFTFATQLGLKSGAGVAVVAAIAAHKITLRRRSFTATADTGTSKTIRLLVPAWLRNVPITDGSYLRPSGSIEVSLPGAGDSGATTYRYSNGLAVSSCQIDTAVQARLIATLKMIGMVTAEPTATRATGASSALAPLLTQIFSTASEMYDVRLLKQVDETVVQQLFNSSKLMLDNKVSPVKALAYAGAADLVFGDYNTTSDIGYFVRDNNVEMAVDENTDCTHDMLFHNSDGGLWFDLPMCKVRKGDETYAANAAVTGSATLQANRDPATGIQFAIALFAYLP